MISGIGTDIIEVSRIKDRISNDPALKRYLFTRNEIRYCDSKITWSEAYAGRFAAKEAFLKALGTGLAEKMRYRDIEITLDPLGKPGICVSGYIKEYCDHLAIDSIFVSISHVKELAIAMVVIQTKA